ncbi:hypothetical protein [Gemmatimonas sp.]|uniref:hypothetical protein n=1 Tax=Gemmatimonas sp. TaxID=1962908 RepID=UPI00334229BC
MASAVMLAFLASLSLDVRRVLAAIPQRFAVTHRSAIQPSVSGHAAPDDLRFRAVFVAQRADCNGNLSLANVVATGPARKNTAPPELIIQGNPRDTIGLRLELPFALRNSPLRLLRPEEQAWLHDIGHHATPVLLLFDHESRLRISSHVDANPVARVALGRAITHLVTDDPSH